MEFRVSCDNCGKDIVGQCQGPSDHYRVYQSPIAPRETGKYLEWRRITERYHTWLCIECIQQ